MAHNSAFGIGGVAFGLLSESTVIPLPTREPAQGQDTATPKKAVRITKDTIKKFVCPPDRAEAIYWDDQATGLGLRCYRSGRRVWLLQYRDAHGRSRRINLGLAASVDPASARERAHEHIAAIAKGANPAAEKKQARQAATVSELGLPPEK